MRTLPFLAGPENLGVGSLTEMGQTPTPVQVCVGWACLFLVGAVYNLVRLDVGNLAAGVGLAVLLLFIAFLLNIEAAERRDFESRLLASEADLDEGVTLVGGVPVSSDTQVIWFHFQISLLVVEAPGQSRYLVRGHHRLLAAGIYCTVITLLLGWWSLPLGPVHAIVAIVRNLRGGSRMRACDLAAAARYGPGSTPPGRRLG